MNPHKSMIYIQNKKNNPICIYIQLICMLISISLTRCKMQYLEDLIRLCVCDTTTNLLYEIYYFLVFSSSNNEYLCAHWLLAFAFIRNKNKII